LCTFTEKQEICVMGYKTIFAPVMFEETTRTILDAALMLAKGFQGHVHAHHIRQRYEYYPPISYYPMAVDLPVVASQKQTEASAAFARTLRSIFDESCDASGARIVPLAEALNQSSVTASWRDVEGAVPMDFGRAARIADLSICILPNENAPAMANAIFESLLMTSARPVLIVPANGLATVPQRVLVAWDGSLPAARAVAAALPFEANAAEVFVITVGEEDAGTPSGEAAAAYLRRNGVKASAKTLDGPKRRVAKTLLDQAESLGCELIVMGGYSHARMYETMLGGVTHHMLDQADRAILLAH
jgi:nucleotide-binding universal stress UspA family protein